MGEVKWISVWVLLWSVMLPFHTDLWSQAKGMVVDSNVSFISPVKHRVRISGTFGELRPAHFHAGLDIKSSNGRPGDPVYAMEDGYISRIKIQSGGYGNSLYITYPGGWTALYAHLTSFTPEVARWVRTMQYKMRSFEVNLYPLKHQFPFKKGEQVGVMGNSGYSFGPHLHLEMRRKGGNLPYNPLHVLPFVEDTIPPVFRGIMIEGLTPDYQVTSERTIRLKGKSPHQQFPLDTIVLPAWRAGISVRVYDRISGSSNKNGIYRIRMEVDGKEVYHFITERCSFKETRYVNAHMNYAKQKELKQYWHRCYVLPGNRLSMYKKRSGDDVFALYAYRPRKITISIEDAAGNANTLQFYVRRESEVPPLHSPPYHYKLVWDRDNYLSWGKASLFIPKGALYRNAYLSVASSATVLPILEVGTKEIPLHRYCNLSLKSFDVNPALKGKVILAIRDKKDILTLGGQWKKGRFRCAIRQLGKFYVALDTMPPTITPIHPKDTYRRGESITFKVTDNFKPSGKARALRYSGAIDGQWVLIQYDLKTHTMKYVLDEYALPGTRVFSLQVTDDRENQSTFTKTIQVIP